MRSFRHSAGFGKRMEFWLIGQMLKEGLDVYVPLVDDNAIDAVVRRDDGSFIEVQIKARSKTVAAGDAALFAAIPHEERSNYWFLFYSERLNTKWLMTSDEFIRESLQNKTGKNAGLRSIWFNGKRKNKHTGHIEEHIYPRFQKYVVSDFSRLHEVAIAGLAAEGGGLTVYGHKVNEKWKFRFEQTSMDIDQNDDECWISTKSGLSDHLADLLPEYWIMMHPTMIHRDFASVFREMYFERLKRSTDGERKVHKEHMAGSWQRFLN